MVTLRLLVLLLLLCFTPAPAVSHDLPAGEALEPCRVSRTVPVRSREKVVASSQVLQRSLKLAGAVMGTSGSRTVAAMMKSLQNLASLAPLIRGLVSSFVTVAMAFVPQENALKDMRAGFTELNQNLDTLSIQSSIGVVDAAWSSYASVYSRDELAVLNAWKKFNEFREGSELGRSPEVKVQLARVFSTYYQDSGAEDGFLNLYRYLTQSSTSLGENMDQLLRTRFRCNLDELLRYHLHISGLLWRGALLRLLHWRLAGFSSPLQEAEHIQMFQRVSAVQRATVDFCLDNYERYLQEDVVEITKKLSPGRETDIAAQVKKHLDQKFSWNSWVVYVFRSNLDTLHLFPTMTTIPVDQFYPGIGKLTVAVGYTQREDREDAAALRKELGSCYEKSTKPPPNQRSDIVDTTECEQMAREIPRCSRQVHGVPLRDLVKVMVVGPAYQRETNEVGEAPEALQLLDCIMDNLPAKVSIHLSRNRTVCAAGWCLNGAACWSLLDSNQQLCDCPHGYYGDRCQHEMETIPVPDAGLTGPELISISSRLQQMEAKLDQILQTLSTTRPSL